MKPTYLAIVLVGIGLALGIVYLVRGDHIYIRQALFWLAVAAISFALAIFPPLVDAVGGFFGIAYPPTLVLLAAIVVLVVKPLLTGSAASARSRVCCFAGVTKAERDRYCRRKVPLTLSQ